MKQHSTFICQQCGYQSPSFLGKCPECGEWNSLVETEVSDENLIRRSGGENLKFEEKLFKLSDVKSEKIKRFSTGFSEFDRVLGGGLVPGSLVLISGDPGIGKSTLLLQTAMRITNFGKLGKLRTSENSERQKVRTSDKQSLRSSPAKRGVGLKTDSLKLRNTEYSECSVLYVSGEESTNQVKMRAERLAGSKGGLAGKTAQNLYIMAETDIEVIVAACKKLSPALLIVDSIQTLTSQRLTGSAGSVGQLRECAQVLQRLAKSGKTAVFVVGHVTKEGAIAGPKVLEHIVDCVLNLEGDEMHAFRILRSTKNRFGSTFEIGVFEMQDAGIVEVDNPSKIFLEERFEGRAGSVVCATVAGGRPILAEIQALCTQTVFAVPTRRVTGLDFSRVQIVIAALSKAVKLSFANLDVFVNVAGGLKIVEPAADLACALAVASAALDRPIKAQVCVFGEVGLLGEVRQVVNTKVRLSEAKRLGFDDIVFSERFKTLEEAIGYAIHGE